MSLPVTRPLAPMEARSSGAIPTGGGWQYEPKWDGFRCLAFRDTQVELQSKSGQPLERYFPELVSLLGSLRPRKFVLDGEIMVPVKGRFSFDQLLQRIHPAASRVRKLAAEFPAWFVAFDLLVDERGRSLVDLPLHARRKQLERFAAKHFEPAGRLRLSPATVQVGRARRWLESAGGDLDGIVAKKRDLPYLSGERDGMLKVKPARTADCVVGGFRYASRGSIVGSLLLGLYDEEGLLHHVGFTSSLPEAERRKLTPRLESLVQPPGFTGRAPGGPSRWSTRRSSEWEPLDPKPVVEVAYDHFSGGRFRHGTTFHRWRPDKAPPQCTMDQVSGHGGPSLRLLRVRTARAAAGSR